jgi:hypothetical protein
MIWSILNHSQEPDIYGQWEAPPPTERTTFFPSIVVPPLNPNVEFLWTMHCVYYLLFYYNAAMFKSWQFYCLSLKKLQITQVVLNNKIIINIAQSNNTFGTGSVCLIIFRYEI